MILEVNATATDIRIGRDGEGSIHLQVSETRDATHHIYLHPSQSIHIHYTVREVDPDVFRIFIHG